jgi:hypothetical protein
LEFQPAAMEQVSKRAEAKKVKKIIDIAAKLRQPRFLG